MNISVSESFLAKIIMPSIFLSSDITPLIGYKSYGYMIGFARKFDYEMSTLLYPCSGHSKSMAAGRLENVTQTISRILEGYDIRLRPNFGGKYIHFYLLLPAVSINANLVSMYILGTTSVAVGTETYILLAHIWISCQSRYSLWICIYSSMCIVCTFFRINLVFLLHLITLVVRFNFGLKDYILLQRKH